MRQTYTGWELIIVDDAGTDNTRALIKQFYSKDKRIKYIRYKKNGGPSKARNVGIKHATGEYIAFLDSDDEWFEYHLEECLLTLSHTGYSVCSALWIEERNSNLIDLYEYDWFQYSLEKIKDDLDMDLSTDVWMFDQRFFEYILVSGFYCYHINSIVLSRKVINQVGFFNENMRSNEDIEYLHRIFERFSLTTVNNPHFIYHYGKDNIYAFVDRSKITYQKNKIYAKKLTRNLIYKIVFYMEMQKLVNKTDKVNEKKEMIKFLDYQIFTLSLSIAWINQKWNQRISIRYLLNAFKYIRSIDALKMLLGYKKENNIVNYFWFG